MQHTTSRLRVSAGAVVGLLLVAGTVYGGSPTTGAGSEDADVRGRTAGAPDVPDLAELEARVDRVHRGWAQAAAFYEAEVAPIERVLLRYKNDEALAKRVAAAVVREAHAVGLDPRLLVGVLLVENPWLDPEIRSSVGAVGLMQIMPVHQGGWSCGYDLERIDTNVCLGARVFAHYLQGSDGDLERALLRYNGCVTGSNTPNCHRYPSRVLARAGQLAWAGQSSAVGSP